MLALVTRVWLDANVLVAVTLQVRCTTKSSRALRAREGALVSMDELMAHQGLACREGFAANIPIADMGEVFLVKLCVGAKSASSVESMRVNPV